MSEKFHWVQKAIDNQSQTLITIDFIERLKS
jgi:hypothetical protein